MKRLLIDMDDVICENGFIRMINEFLGTNYKSEDANSYYVNDLIPKDKFEEWVKFFEEKNVYDYVNIVKDAPEVIEKLNEFYDIYIITAYIFRDKPEISGNQLKNKFDYLTKNLPFIDPKKFIFLSDKELVDADIRIDDSVDKLKGKMAEAHVSQDKLSKQLGITVQSLNAKINGRSQFTLEEVVKITAYLNLEDPVNIFFKPNVLKMQQMNGATVDKEVV